MTVFRPPRSFAHQSAIGFPDSMPGRHSAPVFSSRYCMAYGRFAAVGLPVLLLYVPGVKSDVDGTVHVGVGRKQRLMPLTSYIGPCASQRTPAFKVRLDETRQRSCTQAPPMLDSVQV